MNSQLIRGRVAAGICILTALGLSPITAPPAAGGGIAITTVGDAVTQALVAAAGSAAIADNSMNCMGNPNPQPLAYRTDRVVLRTRMSAPVARYTVGAALNEISVPAEITGADIISVDRIPVATGIVPTVVVSFRSLTSVPVPVVRLARHLRLTRGIPSSPDYLMSPSSGPSEFWPWGQPEPTTTPAPQRAPTIGTRKTIFLYDTGLLSNADGNIPPNVTRLTPADIETPDTKAPFGVVDLGTAGHATAVAGVVNTIAPGAAVTAIRITDAAGGVTETSAAKRMAETLIVAYATGIWPDLIINAFGSPACDGGPGLAGVELAPLGLKMVAETVDLTQSLLVASAGNRSSSRAFYPAAFPSVIGVGGLDTRGSDGNPWTSPSRSGPRASFSNWGMWVKAWLPAVGLTTTHVIGYRFEATGPVIGGWALVTGTSFAAPIAAALIAEQMAAHAWSAKTAWVAIRDSGATCSPAIGSGVAIALTSWQSSATTPPAFGWPPAC